MLRCEHGCTTLAVQSALGKLRQEDFEFEADLDYIVRLYLKKTKKKQEIEIDPCLGRFLE